MRIKINIPESMVDEAITEGRIKLIFGNDFEKKEGLLSKILVFVASIEPCAIADIYNLLLKKYAIHFDKSTISRFCTQLSQLGLLIDVKSEDLVLLPDEEKTPMHHHAEAKYRLFLSTLPKNFIGNYGKKRYVWISDIGEKYLEWGCKLNNIPYDKGEETKENGEKDFVKRVKERLKNG